MNHRGSINAINSGKWDQTMRQNYKKIKNKFSMKPNSKEWNDFREKYKCNVFRSIENSKNIRVIVPEGETIESCEHNTRGNDSISFSEVLKKSIELIS